MTAFASPPQVDPNPPHYWIPHCANIVNRAAAAVKITTRGNIVGIVDRKNYLSDLGPCAASFDVYDDFFSYGSGVYHHVTGAYVGGHGAVGAVVGSQVIGHGLLGPAAGAVGGAFAGRAVDRTITAKKRCHNYAR